MYQIIITQWGLSLGEIETINNLLSNYKLVEYSSENNTDFASIFEIEFIKNAEIDFFECIPIEKWTLFIEILKNIKKRRGKKGLKFKIQITEYFELDNKDSNNQKTYSTNNKSKNLIDESDRTQGEKMKDVEEEEEEEENSDIFLQFFKEIIFFLDHKNDSDFNKGLERIEITIENIADTQKKIFRNIELEYNQEREKQSMTERNNQSGKKEGFTDYLYEKKEKIADLYIFSFDEKKRTWKNI